MKFVVYGIVDAQKSAREALPLGLSQAPLSSVEHGALAAILSPVTDELASSAGLEQALEYARVVEQLHRRMTVIPMRYGCFVHQPEHAAEFLRRHEREFSDALTQLEGCDEMGVRILVRAPEASEDTASAKASAEEADQHKGRAYLDRRRRFYEQQARSEQTTRKLAEQAQAAFSGSSVRCTWDYVERPDGQLLSLSFLVERPRLEEFRRAFQRFQNACPARAMCSGPYPAYGFVAGLAKPAVAARAELEFLKQQQKG